MGILWGMLGLALAAIIAFIAVSVSNRFSIPHPILLIVAGIGLKFLEFQGSPLINPPQTLLIGFSLIALVVIAFDNCSRFKMDIKNAEQKAAYSLALSSIIFHAVLLSPIIVLLVFPYSYASWSMWILGALVAVLVAETSLDTISEHPQHIRMKSYRILVKESIINTPIILLLAFFLIEILRKFFATGNFVWNSQALNDLLFSFVMGVAVAVVIGIILFKWIRDRYVHHFSPILLILGALITFVLAEKLQGSGLVALVFLGILFGKVFVEKKAMLGEFTATSASLFEVMVFILLGYVISLSGLFSMILASLIIYAIMIITRHLAVSATCKEFDSAHRWAMSLNAPLGISVAAVALFLSLTSTIPEMYIIVDLLVLIVLYSNIAHWWTKKYFS